MTEMFEKADGFDAGENLDTLALTFSGGGFRAACYALGVMDYLNSLKIEEEKSLLQNVVYMSSASGGSITMASYALAVAKGKSYSEFREKLIATFDGNKLLEASLKSLNEKPDNKTEKSAKKLIKCFAEQYNLETMFNNATLSDLRSVDNHLHEICINSTDLASGFPFRHRVIVNPSAYKFKGKEFHHGNENIHLAESVYEKLKIADVVASSSCFPGGFEPLILHEDFAYESPGENKTALTSDNIKAAITIEKKLPSQYDAATKKYYDDKIIPLMDGGITDNTGVHSMIYSDLDREKNKEVKLYDFILVNDVGSFYSTTPDLEFEEKSFWRRLSYQKLAPVVMVLSVLVLIISTYTARNIFTCKVLPFIFFSLFTLIILITFGTIFYRSAVAYFTERSFSFDWFFSSLNLEKTFGKEVVNLLAKYLQYINLEQYFNLAKSRANSVKKIVFDITLNRINKVTLEELDKNPRFKNRKKGNYIYDLSTAYRYLRYDYKLGVLIEGMEKIEQNSNEAMNMGTTLWFDKNHVNANMMNKLIACGRYTTCFNLIEYFSYNKKLRAKYADLYQKLLSDFEKFKTDPLTDLK